MALGLASSRPCTAEQGDAAAHAAARKLGYEGVDAFQAGKFAAASEKLEKAYVVVRAPTLGIWSARALVKLGKLVEATDRYMEVTRLSVESGDVDVQKRAQADARIELERTQALVPTLVINVSGAQASAVTLRVDGASVASALIGEASPLNPGAHHVEAISGSRRASADVTLAESEQKSITLALAPTSESAAAPTAAAAPVVLGPQPPAGSEPDAAPGSRQRTIGWAILAGGGVAAIVGGVTGALAISKRSELDKNPACADDHSCPPAFGDRVDSLNTFRTISTVGFIAGGALAATGLVVVLTAPKADARRAELWMTPTSLGLRGQF